MSPPGQALILFAHGARDPRWAEPLARLQKLIEAEVDSSVRVYQAFLELMSPTLPELTTQLAAQHIQTIKIVPIFLGQGAHVRQDIPKLILQLEGNFPHIKFTLTPAIGENEQVLKAIAKACITSP